MLLTLCVDPNVYMARRFGAGPKCYKRLAGTYNKPTCDEACRREGGGAVCISSMEENDGVRAPPIRIANAPPTHRRHQAAGASADTHRLHHHDI